jgi:predicted Holliday junction resolvase-like endonuclease
MKKILVISMVVFLATANLVVISRSFEMPDMSLKMVMKKAMAQGEAPDTTEPRDSTKQGSMEYDEVLEKEICSAPGSAC